MDITAAATLIAWLNREFWLLTARADSRRSGLIATFVDPASIVTELPRMTVGLAKSHYTWELVEASGCFALHLLGEEHLDWIWRFGLQSGRDIDKFDGLNVLAGSTGSPILPDAIGWMDCQVEARQHTGDRTIYLAKVVESQVAHFGPPLTTHRLVQIAPPHRLAELQRQRHQDSLTDAEAICQWRMQSDAT